MRKRDIPALLQVTGEGNLLHGSGVTATPVTGDGTLWALDMCPPDDGTCWWGGITYRFWMLLHSEWPTRPPSVAADPACGLVHPNVHKNGSVCLAALQAGTGGYTAASPATATVEQVYSLLFHPNADDPLDAHCGKLVQEAEKHGSASPPAQELRRHIVHTAARVRNGDVRFVGRVGEGVDTWCGSPLEEWAPAASAGSEDGACGWARSAATCLRATPCLQPPDGILSALLGDEQ